jgi:adenylate cyclase
VAGAVRSARRRHPVRILRWDDSSEPGWSGDQKQPFMSCADAHRATDRALRLSPRDPLAFQAFYTYGFKALHEGRYGEAAAWCAKAAQVTGANHSYFSQAAALALAGCVGEGRALFKQHLDGAPSLYVQMFAQTGMIRELVDELAKGARLLEAPE